MAILPDWLNADLFSDLRDKYNTLILKFNGTAGGSVGQSLRKQSSTDFDYDWEDDYTLGAWQSFTLNTGYTTPAADSGSDAKLQYRIDSNGLVEIKGKLSVGSVSTNEINSVAIGSGFRPLVPKIFWASSYGGSTYGNYVIIVNTSGLIQVVAQDGTTVDSGKVLYFDMVRYQTA